MGTFLLLAASLFGATRLPPIDECAADPSLARFRANLVSAIEKQDADAVMGALDPKVLVDFGGGQGRAAFRSAWLSSPDAKRRLWEEMNEALSLGCALREGVAIVPSFSAQLDPDADMFEAALAIHPGAAVRDKSGEVVGKLDWELLTVNDLPERGDARIKLTDGREAYVKATDIRSAGDYRLTMEKRRGAWRVTAFVAGD